MRFAECFWGAELGARLKFGGASVPLYEETAGRRDEKSSAPEQSWDLLLLNPLLELQAFVLRGDGGHSSAAVRSPNQTPPADVLRAKFAALPGNQGVVDALAPYTVPAPDGVVDAAASLKTIVEWIIASEPFVDAQRSPVSGKDGHREVLARAVLASVLKQALFNGLPVPDEDGCKELTKIIAQAIAFDTRGVAGLLLNPLQSVGASIGTWYSRRNRAELTDGTAPAAGDILVYQARGAELRDFIWDKLVALSHHEVYLMAHSLGGIACVETLIERGRRDNLKHLITFGSQASFLYEINALRTLPNDRKLPANFPAWSNFYDPNDLLSYLGQGVFGDLVKDYRVTSKLSFPAAHSAYLSHEPFWRQVFNLFDDA
ncbi:hypothetical protein VL15_07460 [Burkholderia cepacia]|uniref:Uncharacterized protein n=1 Tax=Burkholderia cepacia TaxID=292 RepID=A0A0J5X8P7_BURCE|nr:hypothetical protein VL15_07460 [Burkholderia cepacia]